jgi:hypothetical protein
VTEGLVVLALGVGANSPVPGAPTLVITNAGPMQAMLGWSPAMTDWVCQESASLSPGTWTNIAGSATNPVIVPATLLQSSTACSMLEMEPLLQHYSAGRPVRHRSSKRV